MKTQKAAALLLNKANKRLAGMTSIDKKLDLGGGLSVEAMTRQINDFANTLELAHKLESDLQKTYVKLDVMSMEMRDVNQRIMMGVGSRFGLNSDAYQQVGGTRKSKRKRPVRRASSKTSPARTAPAMLDNTATDQSASTSIVVSSIAPNGAANGTPKGVSNGATANH